MARRLFNGNAFSEDGWPYVDEGSCTWIVVPGTNPPVHLQIQNGPPLILLGAWAADWNAHIEPLRDADSACWTPGNSVPTSNHPGGTAEDLDWESHDFQVRGTLNAAQMATMAEMEAFYEGMVFWAGRWDSPVDEMHSQMGYDTYDQDNDRPFPKVLDFIARKIRPDGFSTFRRGTTPAPPPPLSRADRYALEIIAEGQRRGITARGIQIALATALVESNLTMYANSNDPASLQLPHDAVGSDHMSTGIFQQQNFAPWGTLECRMNVACSAGLFYAQLVKKDYNNLAHSPGSYAQAVQGSAFPDRYDQRFVDAVNLYDRLAGTQPQPPPQPPPGEDDWLNMPSNQEKLDAIYNAFFTPQPPENIYREASETVGENLVDSIRSTLSMTYEGVVERLALLGEQASIQKVVRVARGQGPEQRPWAVQRAQLIWQRGLAGSTAAALPSGAAVAAISQSAAPAPDVRDVALSNANAEINRLREENARLRALPVAPVSTELATIEPVAKTSGEHAAGLIDSVEDWTKLALTMDVAQRHALAASIKVLEMKNGTEQ